MRFKENKWTLLFILLIALAYSPMLTGLFAIKNDALVVSYPIYYFFGSQLQQGVIPFWHYNLNAGFPLHAEVGSLFWNFWLWVFPVTSTSIYGYTLEIALHILISAAGMYKLGRYLKFSNQVSSLMMFCYVCSGFYVAHLQHPNNIFESAYIPFVLLYFLKTVFTPTKNNAVFLGISLFFLINSGYPGCPIMMIYFLGALSISLLLTDSRTRRQAFLWAASSHLLLAIVLAAVLSAPLLVSFIEISGDYFRSDSFKTEKITNAGGMTVQSLLSVFWPFSTPVNQAFYHTDIAWNNIYTGTLLGGFFVLSVFKVKNKLKWPLLSAGILLLLFSFQGPLKIFFYEHLPLLGLVRSNGSFRIYFVITVIIIACFGIEKWIGQKQETLKNIFLVFGIVQLLAILLIVFNNVSQLTGVFGEAASGSFKRFITVPVLILIQSVFNLCLLWSGIRYMRNKNGIIFLLVFDLFVSFLFNLPFTGLTTKSTAFIQTTIGTAISQINKGSFNANVGDTGIVSQRSVYMVAPAQFLNKSIRIDYSAYPAKFKTYAALIESGNIHQYDSLPSVFNLTNHTTPIALKSFVLSDNRISFSISAVTNDSIVLFQHFSTNWKCFLNEKETAIGKTQDGFMKVPAEPGNANYLFVYRPAKAIIAFYASLVIWILIFLYLYVKRSGNIFKRTTRKKDS